jgi:hypothetical protein
MANGSPYWFPAKSYGWGWGLPITWQGWVVIAVYCLLIAAGVMLFPPVSQPKLFTAYILAVSAVLVAICWLTGETPRWRWGRD